MINDTGIPDGGFAKATGVPFAGTSTSENTFNFFKDLAKGTIGRVERETQQTSLPSSRELKEGMTGVSKSPARVLTGQSAEVTNPAEIEARWIAMLSKYMNVK